MKQSSKPAQCLIKTKYLNSPKQSLAVCEAEGRSSSQKKVFLNKQSLTKQGYLPVPCFSTDVGFQCPGDTSAHLDSSRLPHRAQRGPSSATLCLWSQKGSVPFLPHSSPGSVSPPDPHPGSDSTGQRTGSTYHSQN